MNGKSRPVGGDSAMIYVLAPAKGENHDMAPGDQLAILRRLSSFSDKEVMPITVIFVSRPLRKVPEGSRQGAVVVRYAMPDQLVNVVQQAVTEARQQHSPVIVSDRPELTEMARRANLRQLRTATFEKTLDAVCGSLKRESKEPREPREQREHREPREPREQREPKEPREPRKPQETAAEAPQGGDAAPAPQKPAPKAAQGEPPVAKKENDAAILDLIDPL